MKRLAILGVLAAGCLAGPSSLLAARPAPVPAGGQQPQAIAVPADVVAAHPNGQPGGLTALVDFSPAARPGRRRTQARHHVLARVFHRGQFQLARDGENGSTRTGAATAR